MSEEKQYKTFEEYRFSKDWDTSLYPIKHSWLASRAYPKAELSRIIEGIKTLQLDYKETIEQLDKLMGEL